LEYFMNIPRQTLLVLAVLAAAAAVGACGGDGGADAGAAGDATNGAAGGGTAAAPGAGGGTGAPAAGDPTGASGAGGSTNASGGSSTTAGGTGAAGAAGTGTGGTSGGTNAAAGGSGTPVAEVVAAAGTLQNSTAPASYAQGSLGDNAMDALNSARLGAGAGLLQQSLQLDVAAAAHAIYLISNIGATGHAEDASKVNFYDVSPPSRMARAGFAPNYWAEAIGDSGNLLGADCVQQLLNSVYKAVLLLSPATHVGFGFVAANFATTPLCVSNLATVSTDAYGQVPSAGSLLTFPYAGQSGVFESLDLNDDSPRLPLALFPDNFAGAPVIVNLRNADFVNLAAAGRLDARVTKFELTDPSGNLVAAKILSNPSLQAGAAVALNADPVLPAGAVVLVPLEPLRRGQAYTVAFAATLTAQGPALDKTWSFSTRR
jgi:uncharacterized protein YkwD